METTESIQLNLMIKAHYKESRSWLGKVDKNGEHIEETQYRCRLTFNQHQVAEGKWTNTKLTALKSAKQDLREMNNAY